MSASDECPNRAECQLVHYEEVGDMAERLRDEHKEAMATAWLAINKTNETVSELAIAVGKLSGKLIGYQVAGTLIVGIVVFIAAQVLRH